MKPKKSSEELCHSESKMYGTTTIGARGQVVIPASARKDLGLKPGDQLVVLGKFSKFLGLIKIDEMAEFAKQIMDHVAGTDKEEEVKEHMKKTLNAVLKEKKS